MDPETLQLIIQGGGILVSLFQSDNGSNRENGAWVDALAQLHIDMVKVTSLLSEVMVKLENLSIQIHEEFIVTDEHSAIAICQNFANSINLYTSSTNDATRTLISNDFSNLRNWTTKLQSWGIAPAHTVAFCYLTERDLAKFYFNDDGDYAIALKSINKKYNSYLNFCIDVSNITTGSFTNQIISLTKQMTDLKTQCPLVPNRIGFPVAFYYYDAGQDIYYEEFCYYTITGDIDTGFIHTISPLVDHGQQPGLNPAVYAPNRDACTASTISYYNTYIRPSYDKAYQTYQDLKTRLQCLTIAVNDIYKILGYINNA